MLATLTIAALALFAAVIAAIAIDPNGSPHDLPRH
jgi:hypothetical protein